LLDSEAYQALNPEQKVNSAVFYGLFFTGSIDSKRSVGVFSDILSQYPQWIEPGEAVKVDYYEMVKILMDAGIGIKASEIASWWQNNSKVLASENVNGNLKRTLEEVDNFELAFAMLGERSQSNERKGIKLGFKGFGSSGKVCTLMLHNLREQGLIPDFDLPIAADVHTIALYLRTGALYPVGKSIFYTFSRLIRKASMTYLPGDYNIDISRASYLLPKFVCREYNPKEQIQPDLFDARLNCVMKCALNDWCMNDVEVNHSKGKFEVKPRELPVS
jgi:hypothetical protein